MSTVAYAPPQQNQLSMLMLIWQETTAMVFFIFSVLTSIACGIVVYIWNNYWRSFDVIISVSKLVLGIIFIGLIKRAFETWKNENNNRGRVVKICIFLFAAFCVLIYGILTFYFVKTGDIEKSAVFISDQIVSFVSTWSTLGCSVLIDGSESDYVALNVYHRLYRCLHRYRLF